MEADVTYGDTMRLLRSQSVTSLVQHEIERLILSGEIGAGEKIPEADIASRLDVSRGPVREALRGLGESGLVRLEKARGVFVRTITVEEADETYAVRAALEDLIGRTLAQQITGDELGDLRRLLDRLAEAAHKEQVEAYADLNLEFHDRLVTLTGNRRLVQVYRNLVKELTLFRRQTLAHSETLPTSLAEHREIVESIAAGDTPAAAQAMVAHVTASNERMHTSHGRSPTGRSVNPKAT